METIAEGLWGLADQHESQNQIPQTIKCLEAICTSQTSLLPITEIKTRLRLATLLLKHTHNINHAKSHLERSQLLLKSIPSCFDLKCRTFSLLSQCYQIFGAIVSQKQVIGKGLELIGSNRDSSGFGVKLWECNFCCQLANALAVEGDYNGSVGALERGFQCATEIYYPELQMFFATSMLHVHLMQWIDLNSVETAVEKCKEVWESITPDKKQQCNGLFIYSELLNTFYRLRICDYKNASQHVDRLDAAMKHDLQKTQQIQESLDPSYSANPRQAYGDKFELAPPPIDGEWLPKSAVYALVV